MNNRIAKSASMYRRMYVQSTGKKFWISPGVNKKFLSLDEELIERDIDIEKYIEFCTKIYPPNPKYVFVPINVVCGNKAIQRYLASNVKSIKFSDKDYVYSSLLHIERFAVSNICIKAYTSEYWDPNADLSDYFDELEDYCNSEIQIIYDDRVTYEDVKNKYPGLYDEVVEIVTSEICENNRIPHSVDYREIALNIIARKEYEHNEHE